MALKLSLKFTTNFNLIQFLVLGMGILLVLLMPINCFVSGTFHDEHHCGRPLGMRFDNEGYLVVLDAYLGLYKINVASRQYIVVVV